MKVKTKVDHVSAYGVKAGTELEVKQDVAESLIKQGLAEKVTARKPAKGKEDTK
ncbi:hypothetical protein BpsS36_00012 [Bacillus phage vB_BpsS-36]|uniref:Uncharacterized protein n=1 Tax=Bacillus phage vB_BpsS-36 TaxID=2419622 RepID=A0A3G3BWY1_9CAUD|nr:hypothetical protein BpsS36_00012 [Bacillus phage vB_BpsS-36]